MISSVSWRTRFAQGKQRQFGGNFRREAALKCCRVWLGRCSLRLIATIDDKQKRILSGLQGVADAVLKIGKLNGWHISVVLRYSG